MTVMPGAELSVSDMVHIDNKFLMVQARLRRDRLRVPGHGERGMRGTHRPPICLLRAPTDSAIIPASEQAYASLNTKRLSPQDRGTSLPGF